MTVKFKKTETCEFNPFNQIKVQKERDQSKSAIVYLSVFRHKIALHIK